MYCKDVNHGTRLYWYMHQCRTYVGIGISEVVGIHGNSCLNFKNGSNYKEKIYTFFLK